MGIVFEADSYCRLYYQATSKHAVSVFPIQETSGTHMLVLGILENGRVCFLGCSDLSFQSISRLELSQG